MITDDLVQFIRAGRASGMSEEELERLLITEGGWDRSDVLEARRMLDQPAIPPPASEPQIIETQHEVEVSLPPQTEETPVAGVSLDAPEPRIDEGNMGEEPVREKAPELPQAPAHVEATPPLSLDDMLDTKKKAPEPEKKESTSGLKFNLSALRHSSQGAPAPTATSGASPSSPQNVSSVRTPDTTSARLDTLLAGGSLTMELKSKRTMSSDLLEHALKTQSETKEVKVESEAPPAPEKVEVPIETDSLVLDLGPVNVPAEIAPPLPHVPAENKTQQESAPLDPEKRKKALKRALLVVLGVVFIAVLVAGGYFAFRSMRSPNSSLALETGFAQFFSAPSFTYKIEAMSDVILSTPTGGTPTDGAVKFTLGGEGTLLSGVAGYSDGNHTAKFTGGWTSGATVLSTTADLEIRAIGSSLFVHMRSLPAQSELDPELFKSNWIRIDYADIAGLLHMTDTSGAVEEYGSLGGTSGETAFNTLLKKSLPIRVSGKSTVENSNGVNYVRTPVAIDAPTALELTRALYQKYMSKELVLSDEEAVRLKGAFQKITGDVWTEEKTGALASIVLRADLDDDVVTAHARGHVEMSIAISRLGTPPSVETPAPSLTLSELKVYMDDFQRTKEKRARDQVRVERMGLLTAALEAYKGMKGRYPKDLTELYGAGNLATTTIDDANLKEYAYRSYQKDSPTKRIACVTKGNLCGYYHIAISLEDSGNTNLSTDADVTTAIKGSDTAGCGGEAGFACYDLVSPSALQLTPPAPPSATTTPSASTPPPASGVDALGIERMKSRDTKRIADLGEITLALASYFAQNNTYPNTLKNLVDEKFLTTLPADPLDATQYAYHAVKDAAGKTAVSFVLGASLEDGTNPVLFSADDKDAPDPVVKTGDSTGCNGEASRHCYDL